MKVWITNDHHIINLESVSHIEPYFYDTNGIRFYFNNNKAVVSKGYKTKQEVYDVIKAIYIKMNSTSSL